MATIYDIAKKLNLSTATVSRVLNGVNHPVSEETKRRIFEAARELDYRPNSIAKSLSKGRTQTIAILLPSITNDFYTQFVDIIDEHVSKAGYCTFLCNTHRDIDRESWFVNTLIERRVDGVLFCPTRMKPGDNAQNLKNVDQLCRNHIPVVAIGSHFERVSRVYVDTFKGAHMAADYLISLGHRVIGFIDGLPAGTSRRRYRGYMAALRQSGIEPGDTWVCHGDLTFESGLCCALELMDTAHPTAILTVNNRMAVGVLTAARQKGLRVPDDLSVIGFDDSPVSELVYPQLTVVRQPLEEIGRSVARLLSDQIIHKTDPETVRLLPELLFRDSCAKAKERNDEERTNNGYQ